MQYHYLKRPYRLIPATAENVPRPVFLDPQGRVLVSPGSSDTVARTVYEIRILPGIPYQAHQCFARGPDGSLLYHSLPADLPRLKYLSDLPQTGTRELVAQDYVNQIKRLADPTLSPGCPILPVMAKYILGMEEYAARLREDLEKERSRRRATGGAFYNAETDERANPITLDLDAHPLPGAMAVDRYTYRIVIEGRYPQILYWLAMPFFAPVPREALSFYSQGALLSRNITLDRYPVGTGPYRMQTFNPNKEIVLVRNETFHGQEYPREGDPGDAESGLLESGGESLPFIERIVLKLEKEAIPRWVKFLQGYYDASGIPSESFDQAVTFSPEGSADISGVFKERGLRLEVEVQPVTYYFAFNMLDDVFGGYTEDRRKLRRAIAIAIDTEERIQIFYNGRGMPAHSLIPPGIFGHGEGEAAMDPFTYAWNPEKGKAERRSVDEARRLLSEAGYPQGRDKNGKQLAIRFANAWTDPQSAALIRWMEGKFSRLGIRLVNETTDYNRFREKAQHGNFQLLHWGWHADYPDPENFLFLLYGPNGQVRHEGENHSNYASAEFDALFKRLETMENSPERLGLIREANRIAQRDAPMIWGLHPVSFVLYHGWLKNTKPTAIAYSSLKYRRLETRAREGYRSRHNRPVTWPIFAILGALSLAAFPALLRRWRSGRASA